MKLCKIIRLFEQGNVCVSGLRGTGKDMLMANVVVRRKLPYVSNVSYGGVHYPLDFGLLDCGLNTYRDFIEGTIKPYIYPYDDGTDIYISDGGIYLPAQYCNEINKYYGHFATFMALSRHLGDCNVHFNVQNLNRMWDKVREQSDIYINCRWCVVICGIVIQSVRIYELYDSAVKRVPPFRLPRPLLSPDRQFQWKIQKQNYEVSHGSIQSMLLVYRNKSTYNTRLFQEVLANA